MKKKFILTEEEFSAIKDAITATLQLWRFEFIKANAENGGGVGMSKETFFKSLRDEFIII